MNQSTQTPSWKRFWEQWNPEQQRKLKDNQAFMEAYNADKIIVAQNIAISVTQPQINNPRAAKMLESAYKMKSEAIRAAKKLKE